MGLGTNDITVTTAAKFIPDVWINEIREFLRASLVLADRVKLIPMQGRPGDVLHIPDVSEMTTAAKAANTAVTLASFTEGEFTLTINKHRAAAFGVEDIVSVQSMYDLRQEYTKSSAFAIAKNIDTALAGLSVSLTTNVIGSDGATAFVSGLGNATDLAEAGLRAAIETMDTANVPDDGQRCLWAHPSQKNVLLGIARFTEYQMIGMGGMPLRTGMFGEIFGVPVYFSTQPTVSGTAHTNFLLHRNAIALALQQSPRVQAQYRLDFLEWLFVVDVIYGYGIYRQNHIIGLSTPV